MPLSTAATTLGRAVSGCAHCGGPVHQEPSFLFYQAAASVFAVLLLTGVVGEIRELRGQMSERSTLSTSLRRLLFGLTAILIVVMAGELIALLVLLESPSSPAEWQQVAVGACLGVSVLGIPLLALAPILGRLGRELGLIGRVLLASLLLALLAAGIYLLYTAIHRPVPHRYQVFGTCVAGACGLNERSRPTIHSRRVGRVQDGDIVEIECQVRGEKVITPEGASSRLWDKLTDGRYVSDVSVDTPSIGSSIPACPH